MPDYDREDTFPEAPPAHGVGSDEIALTPSNYRAPRSLTSLQPLTPEEEQAALRAALEPHPGRYALPAEREAHVAITVRPGDSATAYANRRAIGWMRELEGLVADADEEQLEFKRRALGDLLRLWHLGQVREDAARKNATTPEAPPGGPAHLHLHQHQHQHGEQPDLSRAPTEQLVDLARALAAQTEAGQQAHQDQDILDVTPLPPQQIPQQTQQDQEEFPDA